MNLRDLAMQARDALADEGEHLLYLDPLLLLYLLDVIDEAGGLLGWNGPAGAVLLEAHERHSSPPPRDAPVTHDQAMPSPDAA